MVDAKNKFVYFIMMKQSWRIKLTMNRKNNMNDNFAQIKNGQFGTNENQS